MSSIRCIGICTGGGDAPGLNAVIRAAVKAAFLKYKWRVIGIPDGFDGLIWPEKSYELTLKDVSGILPRGGTILGTTNRGNPFRYCTVENGKEVVRDISDQVIANARKLGIDAVITIGGDGSQKIALELFHRGMKLVGVPKTIDNDLSATEVTFGFDTALATATDAVDKIHTTAESHHRIMVVEVMGRDAGWIALEAGIAGGAHVILIPEIPFTIENVCKFVAQREGYGKRFTIVIVAEGVKLPPELSENRRAGAVGNLIGNAIATLANKEVRVSVLGHIQRGGSPTPFDRILGTRFGVAAVDLIAHGSFGKMVCLRSGRIEAVDIADAIGRLKIVDPHVQFVAASLLSACNRGGGRAQEIAYVSAPQAFLRDQVATVYSKTGTVKNGDAVRILGRERRFARVRTSDGTEGWIEQRFLISKQTYEQFQKLARNEQNDPVQATGITRNATNIHLEPNRDAEHLYLLDQGAKISIFKRATSEKVLPGTAKPVIAEPQKPAKPPGPAMEDWWLMRDAQGHVGWVLARMVDVDVPLEIAQYAEGQRTIASFVLNEVADGDKRVPQYLALLSENKDGMPFDYNAIRVFTWNVRRHRYETAYRERNLNGVLPVMVSKENFDKEGELPVFVLRVKDEDGNLTERKYKLATPIVKRVLAPGEQPPATRKRTRRR